MRRRTRRSQAGAPPSTPLASRPDRLRPRGALPSSSNRCTRACADLPIAYPQRTRRLPPTRHGNRRGGSSLRDCQSAPRRDHQRVVLHPRDASADRAPLEPQVRDRRRRPSVRGPRCPHSISVARRSGQRSAGSGRRRPTHHARRRWRPRAPVSAAPPHAAVPQAKTRRAPSPRPGQPEWRTHARGMKVS